jgi:phenylalanyl-tRNA synthetase beta chain
MRFSENWLREWVDIPLSGDELAQRLTMAGLEVGSIEAAADFQGVVVGRVDSVEPHPEADRLRICRVAVGEDEALQIVCGAPNVKPGMWAPLARVGARLPGQDPLEPARIRGVDSRGMLCSAKELDLGEAADGLMELPADSRPGADLRQVFGLDDQIIDIELTPNRGDCLSIAGVARESAVIGGQEMIAPVIDGVAATCEQTFGVELQAPADCPRYAGRVIRNVDPKACTPLWMVERLRRSGVRSLGPLVDVTNYVMLEIGQPMHAFDLRRLEGGIVVRRAHGGETMTLLDGTEIELDEDLLVITDRSGPVALAGIMGGEGSACDDDTRDVFLESAFFSPAAIVGRARRFGLHTESSHRFERGVDPAQQALAVERATRLLIDIAGGEPGPVVDTVSEQHLPVREAVDLRAKQLQRLLGIEVGAARVEEILRTLKMQVSGDGAPWQVLPPSFRFDIAIEADLIEEVARIHGYEDVPSNRPAARLGISERSEGRVPDSRIRSLLVDRGYQEAITYSFVDPKIQALLDPEQPPVPLTNPISADMAVMRTTTWPGLVAALRYNLSRQQSRVRLFELGLVFLEQGGVLEQPGRLGGLICGRATPEHWDSGSRKVDFFDLKGDVEALIAMTGRTADYSFRAGSHPALHPGRTARVECGGKPMGWLGALHPKLEKTLGLETEVYLFELDLASVSHAETPAFREVSRFPAIRRDLAIVVSETVNADAVRECVSAEQVEIIRDLRFFDEYRGQGVEPGSKSLAIGLILQAESRTLTDDEVDAVIQRIISALERKLGATLRT